MTRLVALLLVVCMTSRGYHDTSRGVATGCIHDVTKLP